MRTNPNYMQTKETVARFMTGEGWTRVDDLSFDATAAIATKEYETAVGMKQAIAYFTSSSDNVEKLTVDYQSEGRNIAALKLFDVQPGATVEDIQFGVKKFCKATDNAVDKSYARRLFLPEELQP